MAAPGRRWAFARLISGVCLLAGVVPAAPPPADAYVVDNRRSAAAVLRPVSYDAVNWTTGFWAERYRQLVDVTLDESWRLLARSDKGHVIENFQSAARPGSNRFAGTEWQDEWMYKWLEAAACVWRTTRDPELAQRMDGAIDLIAAAQEPDGYISTNITATGRPRFAKAGNHELYNMGHLLTAAVIHHRMTGRDNLLQVAIRTADFMAANVGKTVDPYLAQNPSALMGLVELYRLTGGKKYLDCARLIVDRRGTAPAKTGFWDMARSEKGTDMIQDRVPVRKSTEVVGHNVFYTYLYTGAGDIVAEGADAPLDAALDRLWRDLTGRRMFIQGGVSAIPTGLSVSRDIVEEAAGAPYQLPNGSCYNETCGQIGVFMWGYRMLANHPEARFADVMEREMFNGFLPCLGLEGKSWFYRAILRRYDENYKSSGWTDMVLRQTPGPRQICCPSNLLRTLAELKTYFYNLDDAGIWVHQYGGTTVDTALLSGGRLAFDQITDYPWGGLIKFIIRRAPERTVAFRLRVPDWAASARLSVNGADVPIAVEHGYVTIGRTWKVNDTLALSLPMEAQLVTADPRIEEARNQVAVMRGPVVYCVESPDLPKGVDLPSVFVPSDARFTPVLGLEGNDAPLARTTVVLATSVLHRPDPRGASLYRAASAAPFSSHPLRLIPYFAWANRGQSTMSIWLPVVWKGPASN